MQIPFNSFNTAVNYYYDKVNHSSINTIDSLARARYHKDFIIIIFKCKKNKKSIRHSFLPRAVLLTNKCPLPMIG